MIKPDRTRTPLWLVAWVALLLLACVGVLRSVGAYPRWDFLGLLALAGAGAVAWWVRVRGGGVGAGRPRRGWWPARRQAVAYLGPGLAGTAALVLTLSVTSASEQQQAILSEGFETSRVQILSVEDVERVDSKQLTRYYSKATVALPEGEQPASATGDLVTARPPAPGDTTWALHAPDDPSLGVILGSRSEVDALTGGPLPLNVLWTVLFPLLLFAGLGVHEFRQPSPRKRLTGWCASGGCASVPLRVGSVSAGRYWIRAPKTRSGYRRSDVRPALVLTSQGGNRVSFFVERCLPPDALASDLGAAPGRLYWPTGEADGPSELGVPAVLLLDDGRYLYGTVPASGLGGDREGVVRHEHVPEDIDRFRAVGPYTVHRPGLHRPGVAGAVLGFGCAVLLATGLGSGGADWLLTPLLVLLFAAPATGQWLTARNRTRALHALREETDGFDPADPERVAR
ncbi:hypothetical protein [Streptomyces sp. HNM0574]|uniref:hypothetical protein n=1 Tax=Streptomyces sp. HNM0574 TaxID=2714954 RepID=UPI00146C7819|nr:hypothetical protein [Streptomyces sp. HNM0574]NLU69167.1 hypothetical protein [Streptomyces sp. HNM0574]